jgi:hypothetical protein
MNESRFIIVQSAVDLVSSGKKRDNTMFDFRSFKQAANLPYRLNPSLALCREHGPDMVHPGLKAFFRLIRILNFIYLYNHNFSKT